MIPLITQSKVGVGPPFTGDAVNVTEVPAQTGFWLAVMFTLTVQFALSEDPANTLIVAPINSGSRSSTSHRFLLPIMREYYLRFSG
jgi:hypothetical protein